MDRDEGEEEQGSLSGPRFGPRRPKRRSDSHHQLVMDCVSGTSGVAGEGPSEEAVPLPDYERLTPSARVRDDPEPPPQQQKPAAWKLIDYVRSRHKSGRAAAAAGGCSAADGDARSSDGVKEADNGEEKKKKRERKRSSWLPDPDRRWPVQGFS